MTTMLQRAQAVGSMLSDLENERRNIHVRGKLELRTQEWKVRRDKLAAAQLKAEWVEFAPEQAPPIAESWNQLRRNAGEALSRLESGDDVSKLTEDPLWTRLLGSAENATGLLNAAVSEEWRRFVDELGALESPEKLEATLPKTPANRRVLQAYAPGYAEFRKLAGQEMPRSPGDKESLRQAISGSREVLSGLERNVPEEVENFFRAIDAGSATLSLITPSLLRWLEANGQLDNYQVRVPTR
ncbi:hypothetical protein [Solimonas sp. SE-A11]|uniref:hypothetical protein n=1 Tax=Solimonas sp. SE-A11 TaxID=3054954 RepID=UPI00259CAA00|nr:hypothetical protein [Solimonas sp. SE-A11]MDM4769073.1 hypothetical protein [Solimonas sp. SE-A11]